MTSSPHLRKAANAALLASIVALFATRAAAEDFTYMPAGLLVTGSGQGRVDSTIYVPGIRFPIEQAPAYANSQVWGHGGMNGPSGTNQCDSENYSYPWWDSYCETRTWDMPLCPSGTGHQGVDIRPSTCDDEMYWSVAVDRGTITNIGSYSVYLVTNDGTQHRYLHMAPGSLTVSTGDQVVRGQLLGKVSDAYGDSSTTIHLHYAIFQNLQGYGGVFVPPYASLVAAYEDLITPPPDMGVPDLAGETPYSTRPDGAAVADGQTAETAVVADGQTAETAVIAGGQTADGAMDSGLDGGCGCTVGTRPLVRSPLASAWLVLGLSLAIRRRRLGASLQEFI